MMKRGESANKAALQFRQHRTHGLLLLVQIQKFPLHRLAQLIQVRSPIALRTETSTSAPVLTSTPSSTAMQTSPSASVSNTSIPGASAATQSSRWGKSPNEPCARLRDDAQYAGLLGEDLEGQENLKIHACWLHVPASLGLALSA